MVANEISIKMEQFSIILDNASALYYSGQVITGRVVLKNTEAQTAKGILLNFEGKATCHWTESRNMHHGSRIHNNNLHHRRRYDSSDIFIKCKQFLIGNGETEEILPSGETFYPFTIQLPVSGIYSSFQGAHGKVEYLLKATVRRSMWKMDYKAVRVILVSAVVDLNRDHIMEAQPVEWNAIKHFCCFCCASGPLAMTVKMSKTGYTPGEIVYLEVDVNNQSNKQINDLSWQLFQTVTFFAEGGRKQTVNSITFVKRSQLGEPNFDCENWRTAIQVPVLPPTNLGGCRIINLDYSIMVEVHVNGTAINLRQTCPIIIGTIPFFQSGSDQQQYISTPTAPPLDVVLA